MSEPRWAGGKDRAALIEMIDGLSKILMVIAAGEYEYVSTAVAVANSALKGFSLQNASEVAK